jgi:hypothetical protein
VFRSSLQLSYVYSSTRDRSVNFRLQGFRAYDVSKPIPSLALGFLLATVALLVSWALQFTSPAYQFLFIHNQWKFFMYIHVVALLLLIVALVTGVMVRMRFPCEPCFSKSLTMFLILP